MNQNTLNSNKIALNNQNNAINTASAIRATNASNGSKPSLCYSCNRFDCPYHTIHTVPDGATTEPSALYPDVLRVITCPDFVRMPDRCVNVDTLIEYFPMFNSVMVKRASGIFEEAYKTCEFNLTNFLGNRETDPAKVRQAKLNITKSIIRSNLRVPENASKRDKTIALNRYLKTAYKEDIDA